MRWRFAVYLIAVHLWLAIAAVLLWRVNPWWTAIAEAALVASLLIGLRLSSRWFGSLREFAAASALIDEGEFTTRLRPTAAPELDRLVDAYNRMVDHLRAERVRLQEQQWLLAKIVAASPSGIVTFDLDRGVADVNPSAMRLLGAPREALLGAPLSRLPGAFGPALSTMVVGESRLVAGDGRRVRCQMSEYFDQGFARRFLLMEELTAELHRAEKSAYERAIRMMAHEINNSIGVSNALLSACRHYGTQLNAADRADFERALELAIARGEHLNAFLSRFADVFRLAPPHRTLEDLGEVAAAVLRLSQAGAPAEIDWQLAVDAPAPIASLDRYQVEQVLLNVLKNSREAVGDRGRIVLHVGHHGSGARIEVQDDGCGFDPAVTAPLSSPFQSSKPHGQGIGLTIAREILVAHGFRFGLESRTGGPTRFWIEL